MGKLIAVGLILLMGSGCLSEIIRFNPFMITGIISDSVDYISTADPGETNIEPDEYGEGEER